MIAMHWIINFLAVLLISTSDGEKGDGGGLIFGTMMVLVSALIVIMEVKRQERSIR